MAKQIRHKKKKLTIKQKKFVKEYIKTGNATEAVRRSYGSKDDPDGIPKHPAQIAKALKENPLVKKTLADALDKAKLDDDYVAENLQKIIDGGVANAGDAKPSDALRGLDLLTELKGDKKDKKGEKLTPYETANAMTLLEIREELKGLSKREENLMKILKGSAEEGEIDESKTQEVVSK